MGKDVWYKVGMFVEGLAEKWQGVNQRLEKVRSGADQFLYDERGSMRLNLVNIGDVVASIPIMLTPLAALGAAFTTNPELQNTFILTAGISLVVMPLAVMVRVAR